LCSANEETAKRSPRAFYGAAVTAGKKCDPAQATTATTQVRLPLRCSIRRAARRRRDLSVGYAANLALTSFTAHFAGLTNFINSYHDYQFVPAFENIGKFLAIWLTALFVLVVGLSLVLHSLNRRVSAAFRFVFYLPAALAGSASVMLWLLCCSRRQSMELHLARLGTRRSATRSHRQPPGDLRPDRVLDGCRKLDRRHARCARDDPRDLLEAAKLDGAGWWRTAGPRQAAVDPTMDRLHADRRIRRRQHSCSSSHSSSASHGGGLKSDVVAEPAGCLPFLHLDNFNYAPRSRSTGSSSP